MLKLHDIAHWPTERISQRVLYLLIALTVMVFALFYFVAYDRPFADDPSFNAPLFTDVMLSCGLSVWGVVGSVRRLRGKGSGMENNVPALRISRCVMFGTIGIFIVAFLVASGTAMSVNGKAYHDWFWLKVSDMFIYTSVLLLTIAIGTVIYGATKYYRGSRKKHVQA